MRRHALAVALVALGALAACARLDAQPPRVQATGVPLVERSVVPAGSTLRLALDVTVADGLHIQSNIPRDSSIPTVLTLEPPPGVTLSEIVFPPASDYILQGLPEPLSVFDRRFAIGLQADIASSVAPGPLVIRGRLRYQACDDKVCFRPTSFDTSWTFDVTAPGTPPAAAAHQEIFGGIAFGTGAPPPTGPLTDPETTSAAATTAESDSLARFDRFTIAGRADGYLGVPDFLEFIRNAEAGVAQTGWFENRGLAAILLLTALGGLALNLTPCVLPMIPINLAIIGAGARGGRRGRGFALGATYGLAMAVAYGALGLVVILTASNFGTINASPWFNAAIAVLFVVLALAMFDIVTIDFSRLSSRIRFSEASRGTFFLAFAMGAVAALLAGACVAPVVIQVVVFAGDQYARGSAFALALPFVLGLGMALPWPLAGAGIAALPKPGPWMNRVKYVLGAVILVTAVYYGYLAWTLFANRWVDPETVRASAARQLEAGWYSSIDEGLAVAERDGTPVLIDLWATWCKNCLVMDETTLASAEVHAALEGYTKIKFQAEDLDAPLARDLMQRIRAYGLPAYVILKPQ